MSSSNRTRPAAAMTLCVPKTSSESCDQAIFVGQGAGASLFSDTVLAAAIPAWAHPIEGPGFHRTTIQRQLARRRRNLEPGPGELVKQQPGPWPPQVRRNAERRYLAPGGSLSRLSIRLLLPPRRSGNWTL
jgi:hypothetical protein